MTCPPTMSAKSRFDAAVAKVSAKTSTVHATIEDKRTLYGLYKQATEGDITSSRPIVLYATDRNKWDAWNARKGMSKEDAYKAYADAVDRIRIDN